MDTTRRSSDHIIVLPGGGYLGHADYEAEPVVAWIRSLGIESSAFRYPVGQRHPAPLLGVRAEVRRVRADGAGRVGLLGFSAGGHAAALAAVAPGAEQSELVNLAVLVYPVVSMNDPVHAGSSAVLLGPEPETRLKQETSPELLVTGDTPPFFIVHTAEDKTVPVSHSLTMASALAAASIPFELHVYQRGAHDVALASGVGTVDGWMAACGTWLKELGWPRS